MRRKVVVLDYGFGNLRSAQRALQRAGADVEVTADPHAAQNADGLGPTLFCHASPRRDDEMLLVDSPPQRWARALDGIGAAVVVCGHTHMPFDRWIGRTRVVNPGSVGMPFGPAGADWMILGPGVELRHTTYDLERAAERIRASGYPAADEFAAKHVLHPPAAEEMLKLYGQHELKG